MVSVAGGLDCSLYLTNCALPGRADILACHLAPALSPTPLFPRNYPGQKEGADSENRTESGNSRMRGDWMALSKT